MLRVFIAAGDPELSIPLQPFYTYYTKETFGWHFSVELKIYVHRLYIQLYKRTKLEPISRGNNKFSLLQQLSFATSLVQKPRRQVLHQNTRE